MGTVSISLILAWICAMGVSVLGATYMARRTGRPDALTALFVTLVLVSNLVAAKIVGFNFLITTLYAPAATIFFSVTFLLSDIINERFGRGEAQRAIVMGGLAQAAFIAFTYIALALDPAPFFNGQMALEVVLGAVPRIAAASLVTFFISEMLDAYLYSWFRKQTEGRHLWMRYAFSSLPAMLIDSVVFVVLAFAGVQPLLPLIIGLTVIKYLVGLVNAPLMYAARAVLNEGK
jgi:uncharacterized integral membrane protein (TIGR00697 family)